MYQPLTIFLYLYSKAENNDIDETCIDYWSYNLL